MDAGIDATVTCTDGPANGPGTAVFLRYRDADRLAAAQTADAAARGLPDGDNTGCRAGKPTSGGWERGRQAGRLACFTEAATGITIDWTDPRVPARAIVTRSDGDAAVLYDWWSADGFL